MRVISDTRVPIKIWADEIEPGAEQQLRNMAELPFIYKHVAVMPDCHLGKGATVGSVIATDGAIIPAAVGVDLGCVDYQTEFLTPCGWKRISEYEKDEVLVYDLEKDTTFFEKPEYIKLPYNEDFLYFESKFTDQALTPDHRCLVYKYDKAYSFTKTDVMLARNIAEAHNRLALGFRHRFRSDFPCPKREGVPLTDNELRLMVAACADGNYDARRPESNYCVFRFVKQRKIDRLIYLCQENNITYKMSDFETNGLGEVKTGKALALHTPSRFKCLSYLYEATKDQLEIICDEVFYWDGSKELKVFFSKNKDSADFVNYAFAACGYRSVLIHDVRKDWELEYRVFANDDKNTVGISGTPKTDIKKLRGDGFKYCFTTSTSFWVMRRRGIITITGNCGMCAVKLPLKIDMLGPQILKDLRFEFEAVIPLGPQSNEKVSTTAGNFMRELGDYVAKVDAKNAARQLGSLGSGNHFIEICEDENENVWIMLHSGSRNVGNVLARSHIEKAKGLMKQYFISLPDPDLAYFTQQTKEFDDYMHDLNWAQKYAKFNRLEMLNRCLAILIKKFNINKSPQMLMKNMIDCHHNYTSMENHYGKNIWLTRKGAVKATMGTLGIIPGSMGTKSYIVRGKGNMESFCSCSHGAGRKHSRTKAKALFTLEDLAAATAGVECRKDAGVLDEIPNAYKDIDLVMANQADLVEIVHTLKQVLCIKG